MSANYLWAPAPVPSLPVRGDTRRLPVRRLFFVGRNYHAHAVEMGFSVDKAAESPFYFTKAPESLVESGATIPYALGSKNFHYEMELVVVIGKPAFRISRAQAAEVIFGYACGLDMTRRDLQILAREKGRPWDLGKDIEQGSVISEIVPMPGQVLEQGAISLTVNGEIKQQSDIDKLIWNIPELLEDLSKFYHLEPGDLIYTGTPEGVGPVKAGDVLHGEVAGVGVIDVTIGEAA